MEISNELEHRTVDGVLVIVWRHRKDPSTAEKRRRKKQKETIGAQSLNKPMLDMRMMRQGLEFCDIVIYTEDLIQWQDSIKQYYSRKEITECIISRGTQIVVAEEDIVQCTFNFFKRTKCIVINPGDNEESKLLQTLRDLPDINRIRELTTTQLSQDRLCDTEPAAEKMVVKLPPYNSKLCAGSSIVAVNESSRCEAVNTTADEEDSNQKGVEKNEEDDGNDREEKVEDDAMEEDGNDKEGDEKVEVDDAIEEDGNDKEGDEKGEEDAIEEDGNDKEGDEKVEEEVAIEEDGNDKEGHRNDENGGGNDKKDDDTDNEEEEKDKENGEKDTEEEKKDEEEEEKDKEEEEKDKEEKEEVKEKEEKDKEEEEKDRGGDKSEDKVDGNDRIQEENDNKAGENNSTEEQIDTTHPVGMTSWKQVQIHVAAQTPSSSQIKSTSLNLGTSKTAGLRADDATYEPAVISTTNPMQVISDMLEAHDTMDSLSGHEHQVHSVQAEDVSAIRSLMEENASSRGTAPQLAFRSTDDQNTSLFSESWDFNHVPIPVIDEMLCYIQNKIQSLTTDNLIKICMDHYPPEAITASKSLLYKTVKTKTTMKARRGAEKTIRHMEDIIMVMQEMDLTDPTVFVARNLMDLPSLALNDANTFKLIRDMENMKAEVKALTGVQADLLQVVREQNVNTPNTIDLMKAEIKAMASAQSDLIKVVKESAEKRNEDTSANSSVKDVTKPTLPTNQENGPKGAIVTTQIQQISESAEVQNNREASVHSNSSDEDLDVTTESEYENDDNGTAALPAPKTYPTNNRFVARTFTNSKVKNQAAVDVERYSGSANSRPPRHHPPRKYTRQQVSFGSGSSQSIKVAPSQDKDTISSRNDNHQSNIQRKNTQENVFTGTGPSLSIRAASSYDKETTFSRNRTCTGVFVSRLEPRHTTNQLEKFIWNQSGCRVKPEKLPNRYGTYSSFYIPCDKRTRDALLDCSIWPVGTLIKLYFN